MDTHAMIEVDALLDCGATSLFINHMLVQNNGICMHKLEHPITVYNIDGTVNRGGSITEEVTLIIPTKVTKKELYLKYVILGRIIWLWDIHGYGSIILKLIGKQEKWK